MKNASKKHTGNVNSHIADTVKNAVSDDNFLQPLLWLHHAATRFFSVISPAIRPEPVAADTFTQVVLTGTPARVAESNIRKEARSAHTAESVSRSARVLPVFSTILLPEQRVPQKSKAEPI